ncbi:Tumor susceptibility transcribed protein [Dirofilaria immitis]|nr:Tumor susceptibility transcribed protein [Dirofilaria immitis]
MTNNAVSSTVIALLDRAKAKYVDTAKNDILLALSGFPDLTPDVEHFVYPDRTYTLAFRLKGTIPVLYKVGYVIYINLGQQDYRGYSFYNFCCPVLVQLQGNTYNIPVALYLWDTHPYYAPICYVCPTPNMMLKESKTVDKQGRIYLPYLSDWSFPGYDLSGLLQVMAMCFQDSCPVFAKPNNNSRPSGVGSASAGQVQSYTPYPTSNAPGIPPYPTTPASYYPSMPHANVGSGTVQPEHLKASVMSAVEHKIRQRLREKLGTMHAELASIRQTHADLRAGQQKLKGIVDDLAQEQKRMEDALIAYQLLRCYVYDCAIDDAIYFLGQALSRGRISLSNYLKEVRQLSRRQFIYRATLQKCRIKAKLSV